MLRLKRRYYRACSRVIEENAKTVWFSSMIAVTCFMVTIITYLSVRGNAPH